MNLWKEVRDQTLHFGVGLGATLALTGYLSLGASALTVAVFAYLREVHQRLSRGDPWYECGPGCTLDLIFWAAGILTATSIVHFVL